MKTIIRHTSYAILGWNEDRGISDRRNRRSEQAIVHLRAPHPLTACTATACRLTAITAAPSG
jgi:hypothetical protein